MLLVAVTIPYAIFATWRWGAVGAASTLVVTNALYILIGAPLTFRRLLTGQGWTWLTRDVALPLICTAAAAAAFLLLPAGGPRPLLLGKLVLVAGVAYLAAFFTAHIARRRVLQLLAARSGPDQSGGEKIE